MKQRESFRGELQQKKKEIQSVTRGGIEEIFGERKRERTRDKRVYWGEIAFQDPFIISSSPFFDGLNHNPKSRFKIGQPITKLTKLLNKKADPEGVAVTKVKQSTTDIEEVGLKPFNPN